VCFGAVTTRFFLTTNQRFIVELPTYLNDVECSINPIEKGCVWTDVDLIFILLATQRGDMLKMVKSVVSHSVGSRSVVYVMWVGVSL
jgi:hypothetical protein